MVKSKRMFPLILLAILAVSIAPIGFSAFGPAAAASASITINNGAAYTNSTAVTLTLTADASLNITQMRISNDNSGWSNNETYATTKNWTLTAVEGEKTVYIQFIDNVSQVTPASANIILDLTPPTAYTDGWAISLEERSYFFDASYSFDNFGIANYTWNFGDGTNGTGVSATHTYAAVGNYSGELTVKDLAGNLASATFVIRVPDLSEVIPTATPTTEPTQPPITTIPTPTATAPTATPPSAAAADYTLPIIVVIAVIGVVVVVVIVFALRPKPNPV